MKVNGLDALVARPLVEVERQASGTASGVTNLLVPDGVVESDNGRFILDAEGAKAAIAAYEQRAVNIVVDYEHGSIPDYAPEGGVAPAAGWITALWYVKGEGLYGRVEWTARARRLIEDREYRYLSPAVYLDPKTKRAYGLDSVALTNKPAIKGGLPAAASITHEQETVMAKGCLQANQEPGVDGSAPDQLLGQIQQLLKQKGVSLEDGATREAVLKAVISILEGGSDKPPEDEESAQVAANVRKELGLPEKATKEEVLVALATLKRKPEAEAELAAMRSELAAIKEREAERSARELVEADIEANKINPHDEKHVERCIAFAKADPQRYQEFMQGVAPIVATGRTEAPAGGSPAAGEQAEDKLIAESLDAHKGNAKQAYISLQKRLLAELEEGAGYSRAKAANVLRQRYPKIFA